MTHNHRYIQTVLSGILCIAVAGPMAERAEAGTHINLLPVSDRHKGSRKPYRHPSYGKLVRETIAGLSDGRSAEVAFGQFKTHLENGIKTQQLNITKIPGSFKLGRIAKDLGKQTTHLVQSLIENPSGQNAHDHLAAIEKTLAATKHLEKQIKTLPHRTDFVSEMLPYVSASAYTDKQTLRTKLQSAAEEHARANFYTPDGHAIANLKAAAEQLGADSVDFDDAVHTARIAKAEAATRLQFAKARGALRKLSAAEQNLNKLKEPKAREVRDAAVERVTEMLTELHDHTKRAVQAGALLGTPGEMDHQQSGQATQANRIANTRMDALLAVNEIYNAAADTATYRHEDHRDTVQGWAQMLRNTYNLLDRRGSLLSKYTEKPHKMRSQAAAHAEWVAMQHALAVVHAGNNEQAKDRANQKAEVGKIEVKREITALSRYLDGAGADSEWALGFVGSSQQRIENQAERAAVLGKTLGRLERAISYAHENSTSAGFLAIAGTLRKTVAEQLLAATGPELSNKTWGFVVNRVAEYLVDSVNNRPRLEDKRAIENYQAGVEQLIGTLSLLTKHENRYTHNLITRDAKTQKKIADALRKLTVAVQDHFSTNNKQALFASRFAMALAELRPTIKQRSDTKKEVRDAHKIGKNAHALLVSALVDKASRKGTTAKQLSEIKRELGMVLLRAEPTASDPSDQRAPIAAPQRQNKLRQKMIDSLSKRIPDVLDAMTPAQAKDAEGIKEKTLAGLKYAARTVAKKFGVKSHNVVRLADVNRLNAMVEVLSILEGEHTAPISTAERKAIGDQTKAFFKAITQATNNRRIAFLDKAVDRIQYALLPKTADRSYELYGASNVDSATPSLNLDRLAKTLDQFLFQRENKTSITDFVNKNRDRMVRTTMHNLSALLEKHLELSPTKDFMPPEYYNPDGSANYETIEAYTKTKKAFQKWYKAAIPVVDNLGRAVEFAQAHNISTETKPKKRIREEPFDAQAMLGYFETILQAAQDQY